MYAKINTTKGDVLIYLEYEKTPLTVAICCFSGGKNEK